MRKKLLYRLVAPFSLLIITFLAISSFSDATFSSNNLMDDGIMSNSTSMSAGEIDTWLNTFPNSCISPASGFEARTPAGYNPSTGYSYGGFVSAGVVISTAASVYEINPRALLATLEKEQSLVRGQDNFNGYCNNGDEHKYAAAVGYGCPDGGTVYNWSNVSLYKRNGVEHTNTGQTCVNSSIKAGFSQQIIRAAWLLKFGQQRSLGNTAWNIQKPGWDNSDDPQTCYGGPMTQGYRKRCSNDANTTYYDGFITIDGVATHIDTGATAGLYWYTPHFHGNQNFVSLYEGWFGSVHAPSYAWQMTGQYAYTDATKTTLKNLGNFAPGEKAYIGFTAKNIGNTTWANSGPNAIVVGTASPMERSSVFSPGSSWLSGTRPAVLKEASVEPGQTGTFEFWVTAPSQPGKGGIYNERFNLLASGITWLNDVGLSYYINAQPATYAWQMTGQYAYTDASKATVRNLGTLLPGEKAYIGFTAKNVGNMTWSNTGANPITVGTVSPYERTSAFSAGSSWLSGTRPALLKEASVAPGATGTFEFWITASNQIGVSNERFGLIANGLTWLNDTGLSFYTNVSTPTYTWQMTTQYAYLDSGKTTVANMNNVHPGNKIYVGFTAKNTGNMTWSNSGPNAILVGTASPQERSSLFSPGSSWLSGTRPALLKETTVAPQGIGTFEFWLTAPSTLGVYNERFSLIANGLTWLNDTGLSYYVNVN